MLNMDSFEQAVAGSQLERTFFMIKPHAVQDGAAPEILRRLRESGLSLVELRMLRLSEEQVKHLYAAHQDKPWFDGFVGVMTNSPVAVCVLEGPGAIQRTRELMGATDPAKAAPGSLRAAYGKNLDYNAVHGSDGAESAMREIGIFFPGLERVGARPVQMAP